MSVILLPELINKSDLVSQALIRRTVADDGLCAFEKMGKIGFGSYGSVYKARHSKLNYMVALKKFHVKEEAGSFSDYNRSVFREIRVLQHLSK